MKLHFDDTVGNFRVSYTNVPTNSKQNSRERLVLHKVSVSCPEAAILSLKTVSDPPKKKNFRKPRLSCAFLVKLFAMKDGHLRWTNDWVSVYSINIITWVDPVELFFCYNSLYVFGGLECVGHSFDYVAHFIFLKDIWIRTQRSATGSRRATNLATLLR